MKLSTIFSIVFILIAYVAFVWVFFTSIKYPEKKMKWSWSFCGIMFMGLMNSFLEFSIGMNMLLSLGISVVVYVLTIYVVKKLAQKRNDE